MRQAFIEKRFNTASRLIIQQANQIIAEYQARGFVLTLRQRDVMRAVADDWERVVEQFG